MNILEEYGNEKIYFLLETENRWCNKSSWVKLGSKKEDTRILIKVYENIKTKSYAIISQK